MNADHLFLARHEMDELSRILKSIPDLADDMEVTRTRQDCIAREKNESKMGRRGREQPLPYGSAASEASDLLHSTLVSWIRHVCEQRGVEYIPIGYTHRHGRGYGPLTPRERRLPQGYDESNFRDLCHWLQRNIVALAMTEGSEESLDEIHHAYTAARQTVDLPNRKVFQGSCECCQGDLLAYQLDQFAVCADCGVVVDKQANDARINLEIDGRLFTATEMVTLVEARLGVTLNRKRIYKWADPNEPSNHATGPKLVTRGLALGSNEKLFRAGDVFALVSKAPVAA